MTAQPTMMRTAGHPATATTIVATDASSSSGVALSSGTLRLRAESEESAHVQWAEDVVDNEGMGKKTSKVCCIYHKPRTVGESSDEDSSDSSSSGSESESERSSAARRTGGRGRKCDHHGHADRDDKGGHQAPDQARGKKGRQRKPSPNAYEKMPKYDGDKAEVRK